MIFGDCGECHCENVNAQKLLNYIHILYNHTCRNSSRCVHDKTALQVSSMSIIRIPYTTPFPPAIIYPRTATSKSSGVTALQEFLLAPGTDNKTSKAQTLLLTGAGVSVESGLADYRGENGTYRLNKKYRPIFFTEFISNHEARKRYVTSIPRIVH